MLLTVLKTLLFQNAPIKTRLPNCVYFTQNAPVHNLPRSSSTNLLSHWRRHLKSKSSLRWTRWTKMEHVSCTISSRPRWAQQQSKNALSQLIEPSFKDNSWDIDKMHTVWSPCSNTYSGQRDSNDGNTTIVPHESLQDQSREQRLDGPCMQYGLYDQFQYNSRYFCSSLVNKGKWKKPKAVFGPHFCDNVYDTTKPAGTQMCVVR